MAKLESTNNNSSTAKSDMLKRMKAASSKNIVEAQPTSRKRPPNTAVPSKRSLVKRIKKGFNADNVAVLDSVLSTDAVCLVAHRLTFRHRVNHFQEIFTFAKLLIYIRTRYLCMKSQNLIYMPKDHH